MKVNQSVIHDWFMELHTTFPQLFVVLNKVPTFYGYLQAWLGVQMLLNWILPLLEGPVITHLAWSEKQFLCEFSSDVVVAGRDFTAAYIVRFNAYALSNLLCSFCSDF